MNTPNTQIITPRWIIPIVPRDLVLTEHSLVVEGRSIVAIAPRDEVISAYPNADELRLDNQVLLPGFINVHCHAAMTLLRGVADDKEMLDWLTNWIWPIEGQLVDEEFVYDGSRLAALEMLRSGTTCVADSYFFPDQIARAFSELRIRSQIGLSVINFQNAWAKNEEDHIHKALAFRDQVKNHPLITTAFAPHAPYTVTDGGFEKIRLYAEQLDLAIHLHLHETEKEVTDSIAEYGVRPITRMNQLGILSPSLQAVHMTQLRDDEIELLAASNAHIAHCPESNMKLASGVCPVPQLLRNNVNVALGTDGAASNNDLDMLQEGRSASLLAKVTTQDATSLSATEVLEMMTLQGAKFLGMEDEIGSLEIGKLADMTAVDLSEPCHQPVYHPASQLVYTASGRDVTHTWVNGELLMQDRQFTQADSAGIQAHTDEWQQRIEASL